MHQQWIKYGPFQRIYQWTAEFFQNLSTDVLADGLREILNKNGTKSINQQKENGKMILEVEQTFITLSLLKIKKEMLFFWPL